jgi:histidinol dehydrogenase
MLEVVDGRNQAVPVHISRPRPVGAEAGAADAVRHVVDDVRARGDAALLEYTERFDGVRLKPTELLVDPREVARSRALVRPEVIDALELMASRLRETCARQRTEGWVARGDDDMTGELVRPLRSVGLYAPGGRAAYPSSVMMMAVPAQAAGVDRVALASPPGPSGEIAEPVLAACAVAGVHEVYRLGGAQAVAAFAYGTETVRPVEKVVGPGNVYVTQAKRLVSDWVGIDAEAGPTEIAIVADDTASPEIVAADLVAQAEHGPHGAHVLITWVPELAERVMTALELLVLRHEKPDDVENALIEGGRAVLVRDLSHALDTANAFAPEHLALNFAGALDALDRIRNAGAVFVGPESPVSVGDYVAGTNHVLPTGGSARWASGLSVRDFTKTIYVCGLGPSALQRLAPHVDALAEAEGLLAHARAVEARFDVGASR